MTALGSRPADGTHPGGSPPRWWTLTVPCLLTLPVAAWCVFIAALAGIYGCFDTCVPGNGLYTAVGGTEFILGATTVAALMTGLARPAWRRVLRWVIWIACALAWLGGGVMWAWASAHP